MRLTHIFSTLSFVAVSLTFSIAATLDRLDTHFVTTAAEGGLAEVKLGELAKQKGSNQSVTSFGDQMVKDHTEANNELKSIASSKGIKVPESLNAKDQALYDRLSKLSGGQFDRAYISAMVKDHEEDISEFRRISRTAKDQEIKSFASKTLPTLEHHLEMAQQAQKQLGSISTK
jgi:putative membrane protein